MEFRTSKTNGAAAPAIAAGANYLHMFPTCVSPRSSVNSMATAMRSI